MADNATTIDQETVYRLLLEERWPELLHIVHREREAIANDDLLSHAVDQFVRTFFERFDPSAAGQLKSELETLFLLHTGRHYELSEDRFDIVVSHLAGLHEHDPRAAVGYARHRPENPICAEILERHRLPSVVDHSLSRSIHVGVTQSASAVDRRIRLFRSRQEEAFFMAVREVFASYFAYPNVALSALLDFEGVRDDLTSDERAYFFRGVVDCVVFDQQDGYLPRFFFELDSPHHDTDSQRARDRMKDRILARGGQRLLRIRAIGRNVERDDFVRLLREVMRTEG